MTQIDYLQAAKILESMYREAEKPPSDSVNKFLDDNEQLLDAVFDSQTQSYREVLLGCSLIRWLDKSVNIRLPYMKHGKGAFNGRTLDEKVINPFLHEKLIPCSKGPYLATFRRNVMLTDETKKGLRDKDGYDALMKLLSIIESTTDDSILETLMISFIRRFIILRDSSKITLFHINRLSIEQFKSFLSTLIQKPSGGLIPVLISVAFYQMLNEYYQLSWEINWQGINVSDQSTGSEGDIIIKANKETICAIEVTERLIDKKRIVSTFNTKILRGNVKEYLFIYTQTEPDRTAMDAAGKLFSQGYDVNFASIVDLIVNNFAVQRPEARSIFTNKMISLLDSIEIPSSVKLAWNECIKNVIPV